MTGNDLEKVSCEANARIVWGESAAEVKDWLRGQVFQISKLMIFYRRPCENVPSSFANVEWQK